MDKNILSVILSSLIFLITFIILGYLFYFYKKRKSVLEKLALTLPGKISPSFFQPSFNGQYQGLGFSITLIPSSENSPTYLNISLFKNSFFKLRIYKESILSNVGKKLGIIHEVKTYDEAFDKEFLIFSNNSSLAFSYLNKNEIRNTIKEIFNLGFTIFLIDDKKIFIQKPNYNLLTDLEPNFIINLLEKLSFLARGL